MPEAHNTIPSSGSDHLSVGTEGYASYATLKRIDGFHQFAGCSVPQADDGVPTATGDRVPVRTKSDGNHIAPMTFKHV